MAGESRRSGMTPSLPPAVRNIPLSTSFIPVVGSCFTPTPCLIISRATSAPSIRAIGRGMPTTNARAPRVKPEVVISAARRLLVLEAAGEIAHHRGVDQVVLCVALGLHVEAVEAERVEQDHGVDAAVAAGAAEPGGSTVEPVAVAHSGEEVDHQVLEEGGAARHGEDAVDERAGERGVVWALQGGHAPTRRRRTLRRSLAPAVACPPCDAEIVDARGAVGDEREAARGRAEGACAAAAR